MRSRRRRLSVWATTVLLVAAMMASAPPVFAENLDAGCQNGQDQDWWNAWLKHANEEQRLKHQDKMLDCYNDEPPGEGQ
jgi:ABC-type sugar transport system substrate-binding protein